MKRLLKSIIPSLFRGFLSLDLIEDAPAGDFQRIKGVAKSRIEGREVRWDLVAHLPDAPEA